MFCGFRAVDLKPYGHVRCHWIVVLIVAFFQPAIKCTIVGSPPPILWKTSYDAVVSVKNTSRTVVIEVNTEKHRVPLQEDRRTKQLVSLQYAHFCNADVMYSGSKPEYNFEYSRSSAYEFDESYSSMLATLRKLSILWARGIITQELFDFFNANFKCERSCLYYQMQPTLCTWNGETKTLELVISVPITQTNMLLFRAIPFTFKTRNGTDVCLIKYRGPEYLVLTDSGNCISVPLYVRGEIGFEIAYWHPKAVCMDATSDLLENLYHTTKCRSVTNTNTDSVQVVNQFKTTYIYCFGHNLTIFHKTKQCEDKIYSIPNGVAYSIDTESHIQTEVNYLELSDQMYTFMINAKLALNEKLKYWRMIDYVLSIQTNATDLTG